MHLTATRTCPQCGASLPGKTDGWLCPRCLLGQAAALPHAAADLDSADTPAFPMGTNGRPPAAIHYFGDYELIHEIARGGMGVVYRARQVSLNRIVAVKVLLFGKLAGDDFVKRFRAEAEAVASLQHPTIVAIHEVGEHQGQQYFSMEYLDGQSLAERARDNPVPPMVAADHLKTIAEAIHYAHQRGILHRDLKPSNVLIDARGNPRVTDFGLAKRLTGSRPGTPASELTVTGQVLGTPSYMSPEQARAQGPLTVASDVYSLGALLYFMLTGRPPFAADSLEATLRLVLETEPISPRHLCNALPRDLETICLKCLNKEPGKRYATAQALADELGRYLHDEPICARPAGPLEVLWRWCRRKPALAVSLAGLAAALLAGVAGVAWQWQRAARGYSLLAITLAEFEVESERINVSGKPVLGEGATAYFFSKGEGSESHRIWHNESGRSEIRVSEPDSITVWDVANNRPVSPELKHAGVITHAQFDTSGQKIATASSDGTARIWHVQSGRLAVPPLHHAKAINVIRFSPEGDKIATGSSDATARIWDAQTGRLLAGPLTADDSPVISLRFSRDGKHLVTLTSRGTLAVWDARTGRLRTRQLRKYAPPGIGLPTGQAGLRG